MLNTERGASTADLGLAINVKQNKYKLQSLHETVPAILGLF